MNPVLLAGESAAGPAGSNRELFSFHELTGLLGLGEHRYSGDR